MSGFGYNGTHHPRAARRCGWGLFGTPGTVGHGIPGLDLWELSMTEQEIEAKVIEIVAEQLQVEKGKITRQTSFVEDLNADSLDQVELVMELEDEFGTSIPDEQAEKLKTVGEAIEFIKQAKAGK